MRKREIFSAAAALVWLLLMIILYYAGHKPAEPGQLAGLAQSAWRLLATTGLTLLAGGLGRRILKLDELPPLVRLALQAGLGFGLLSIGVLAVGSSLGLPAWLPWAAWLGLSLLMFRPILAWLREWHALAELWSASGAFERLLASLLGIIFLGALAVALAPPTHYDTLVYHLALPDTYLRVGRVSYLPWLMSWGMPQGAELLYTWAAGLGGIETGALMGWCFGLVAMVGLLGWLSQVFDARAAWVAAAALLGGLTPVVVLSSAYVEWLVFLQALGGLILLLEWVRSGRISRLALAGLFCGLAVGSKYTSAVLAAAGVVLLAWQLRRQPRLFLRQAFIFGGTALLAASPWFLKNLLATGNPLHPLFFNSGSVTAVSIKVYQGVQPFGDWLDILFLPLRATMLGFEAGPGYMFDSGWLLAGLGGLLGWMPAGTMARRPRPGPKPGQTILARLCCAAQRSWRSAGCWSGSSATS